MKNSKSLIVACIFLFAISSYTLMAQDQKMLNENSFSNHVTENTNSSRFDKAAIGFGLGFDYGGFGINSLIYPTKSVGLFAGLGYNLAGLGINGGLKLRLANDKKPGSITPYALAMYGYNAVIVVANQTELNKVFYGPTIGIGFDTGPKYSKQGYWSFALLYPIRSSEVDNYIDDLKNSNSVEFNNELFPITISIGYHLILGERF